MQAAWLLAEDLRRRAVRLSIVLDVQMLRSGALPSQAAEEIADQVEAIHAVVDHLEAALETTLAAADEAPVEYIPADDEEYSFVDPGVANAKPTHRGGNAYGAGLVRRDFVSRRKR